MAVKKKAASKQKRPAFKIVIQRLPRSQGITADHIYFLCCGSTIQRDRIRQYGKLNRRVLGNLGRPALQDGTVGKI